MASRENRDLESIKQNIVSILEKASGNREDIAYEIYKELASSEIYGSDLLCFFLECSEQIESSEENHIEKIFSEEEKYQYAKEYGKIIDGTLEVFLKKGLDKKQFYAELWSFINKNTILENDKLRAFALYYIWIDVRVPYFEVEPGIKMANEEYVDIYKKNLDIIKKIRFILNVPTEQKTERASRIINILDGIEENKEKVVLMAQIINMSDKSNILISKLFREKIIENDKIEEFRIKS